MSKKITMKDLRAAIPEADLVAIAKGAGKYFPPTDDTDEPAFPVDTTLDLSNLKSYGPQS